jgi:hypothetical protein
MNVNIQQHIRLSSTHCVLHEVKVGGTISSAQNAQRVLGGTPFQLFALMDMRLMQ